MSKFMSSLAPLMNEYVYYRQASGRWCDSYEVSLGLFDKHCKSKYPDSGELNQVMVDSWCAKRETENNNSCRRRIYPIYSFIRFLQKRDVTDIMTPTMPRKEPNTYIPHAFTENELANFFDACDVIPRGSTIKKKARRLTIPVLFRLLYSSGVRTTEARLLRRSNADLSHGVLNIEYSKGHAQHYVVLNDSILKLMNDYDIAIDALYPNRTYFFPFGSNICLSASWVLENFKKMWFQKNSAHAVPYDFRHNYAIENINSWTNDGFGFTDKLLYLSKSMGHSTIESTKYYYSLVPRLADVMAAHIDEDEMIPEVPYESY